MPTDGIEVSIREPLAIDEEKLKSFVGSLSKDAIYFRFLASGIDR
jgi:hypothetical protein